MRYPTPIDVFDHGIEVTVNGDPPAELARLATTREPICSGHTLAIVDRDGSSLNHRVVTLVEVPGPYTTSDLWDEHDVRYCLQSALYHLNRIIDMYVDKCRLFEELHADAIRGNTDDPRIYFEVDAFLGDARRVYELIRKVLWRHYPTPGKSRWRGIRQTLDDPSKVIPTQFAELLEQSWTGFGEKLTAYRDCISHYVPLTYHGATCWMSRFDGRWGATVTLPTNPESKSRAAFDNVQGNGIDALGYCHGVAVHTVRLCEELMALPAVASHIVNPSPQNYPAASKDL